MVLASGDALFFGVGKWLVQLVGGEHLVFHPNVSSIQHCFHRIGLPWQQAQTVSLHGRPTSSLRRYIANNRLLAIFTDAENTPGAIAGELQSQGFGESQIWVCEQIGSPGEKVTSWTASELLDAAYQAHELNVCIAKLRGIQPALPSFPGIQDEYFFTGTKPGFGMISKREVRLAILSLMEPGNNEIAWDIGAGCGSVSVEWARWNDNGHIFAIEKDSERAAHIEHNSDRFGTRLNLTVVIGEAPGCCRDLPWPDSIFIGGSGGLAPMLDYAWQKLKPGGKLVATAVTDASRNALKEFMGNRENLEWMVITVEKEIDANLHQFTPVTLAKCIKSADI